MQPKRLAVIGECMLEFAQQPNQHYQLGYAGDTFNVALYARRSASLQELAVSYITALGDDVFSRKMLDFWVSEGLDTRCVSCVPQQMPGLYLIDTDAAGERSFYYYRSQAPVRNMFDGTAGATFCQTLLSFDAIYFSGITLAILSDESRRHLFEVLAVAKRRGIPIFFDHNYRPALWPNAEIAQMTMGEVLQFVDVALPSLDDMRLWSADISASMVAEQLHHLGVAEVIVKCGAEGYLLSGLTQDEWVSVEAVRDVVDTTAAGDSFNGGFISKYLTGASVPSAAAFAARLAALVIQHRGAIIDKSTQKNAAL